MTLKQFIDLISPENHDNIICIVDYSESVMAESSIYDILHELPTLSLSVKSKLAAISSDKFLYSVQSTLDFDLEDNSLKVSRIGWVESEESGLPHVTDHFRLNILRKPVIGYSVRLKDIDNLLELNWACHCQEIGCKYRREDASTYMSRLQNDLKYYGFT